MRGRLIEVVLREVVSAIFGFFSPGLGSAYKQLYDWFNSTLNMLIINPLSLLVELLVDILDSVPIIGPPIGNAIEDLAQMFGLLRDKGEAAQTTADAALQLIAAQTMDYVDDFAGPNATNLGAKWVQTYSSGSGQLGVRNGSAHWYASGGAARTCRARYTDALGADRQVIKIVLANNIALVSSPPIVELHGRVDNTHDNYVTARIHFDHVELGYVVSGSYTRLGSNVSISNSKGLWELQVGTLSDDYEFVLYQDGIERIRRTDSGHNSLMGSNYRYHGFLCRAGVGVNPFFLFEQKGTPDIQAYAASAPI
ncbi:hypothetical protein MHAEM_21676 [Mycolicibacterium phlei]|nr:hypothetical protein [Mycolicibacterium phlei]